MGYCVFFDLETQACAPRRLHGQARVKALQSLPISVVSALTAPSQQLQTPESAAAAVEAARPRSFWIDNEEDAPFEPLLQIFDKADVIVGYNVLEFDFVVLQSHYMRGASSASDADARYFTHRAKTLDLFDRIKAVTSVWYKMDELLVANGLRQKTADGLEAVKMWENRERDDLAAYCETDVRLTALLACQSRLGLPQKNDYKPPLQVPHTVFGIAAAVAAHNHESAPPTGTRDNSAHTTAD